MIPVANIALRQDPVVLKSKSESFLYYNAIKEKIIFRKFIIQCCGDDHIFSGRGLDASNHSGS